MSHKYPIGSIVKVNPKISYLARHTGIITRQKLSEFTFTAVSYIQVLSTAEEQNPYDHIDQSSGPYIEEHLILITHADDVTSFEKIMWGIWN